jgi:hypothetical protein
MSILQKFNRIGYYYTFEYYLYEQDFDTTMIDYLKNQNVTLKQLICFFDIIKNGTCYIITTNEENLHKVITITKCDHDINSITDNLIIFYNGYKFTISDEMTLRNAEICTKITGADVANYCSVYGDYFEKFKISDIVNEIHSMVLTNLRILSILIKCKHVTLYGYHNVSKFNMSELFPNLKIIYCRNVIIYQANKN